MRLYLQIGLWERKGRCDRVLRQIRTYEVLQLSQWCNIHDLVLRQVDKLQVRVILDRLEAHELLALQPAIATEGEPTISNSIKE